MSFDRAVKKLRQQLSLSQQAFADEIGVSFSTVNRWENGRHTPNRMAVNTITAFCKTHNIEFEYTPDGRDDKCCTN